MFTKDIFSVFEPVFDKKQHEWENLSWQCLNKQQHCVQFEIRNLRFCSSRAILKGFFISKFSELRRTLRRFPKGKFARAGVYERHHRSFSLSFSDIDQVDEKATRKASNELYFLPLFPMKYMEGKEWIIFRKVNSFKPELCCI